MKNTIKVLAATTLLALIPASMASAHVTKDPHNGVACTPVPAPGTTPPPNIKIGPNFWWCPSTNAPGSPPPPPPTNLP